MKTNNTINDMIKWVVIFVDFLLLNVLMLLLAKYNPLMDNWHMERIRVFMIMTNIALLISEYYNPPLVHIRLVSVADILKRLTRLALGMAFIAYILMKGTNQRFPVGYSMVILMFLFFLGNTIVRFIERKIIKAYRNAGRNTRKVVFVGADSELLIIHEVLMGEAAKGYQVMGYYADSEMENIPKNVHIAKLGTMREFMDSLQEMDGQQIADEIYVSISRTQRDTIRKISDYCDRNVVRFFYVPVSLETLGINLKRELLDDIEIFTTYENPLENPVNKVIKRTFDIVLSSVALLCLLPFFPIIWIIIKTQSPGPLFFKQLRTGLDGKEFYCYKFRSMHVNADADKVQATENDPRKYPFGNFMRKTNVDEFPQFWNVLKGDMSIVGPRPHMLAHTEMYSELISKYMVRHFVKPGVTGWAQVTGFRGETKELWQMEGRVKRDIWYMENWSVWLDIRIMWMTAKTIFVHDKNAY